MSKPQKEIKAAVRAQTQTSRKSLSAYEAMLNKKVLHAREAVAHDNHAHLCIDKGILSCVFTDKH